MSRLFSSVAALLLAGCATTGGGTPALRFYEAFQVFNTAKFAAVSYAEQPSADPGVVHALNVANKSAAPVAGYARAYVLCGGVSAGKIGDVDCALFNFSAATLSQQAIALRAAALSLSKR